MGCSLTANYAFLFAALGFSLAVSLNGPLQQSPSTSATPPTARELQPLALTLDPAQTVIHWTLSATLHTVHGTFRLKRGEILLDPSHRRISGEIVVDAASGQSGNNGRDSKMHRRVLESSKYSEIIFRPDGIIGSVPAQGSFSVQVHGIFYLHGAGHEITVPAQGEFDGDRWKAAVSFSVPYVKWGLKDPSTFFLKVKQEVEINIEAAGKLQFPKSETRTAHSTVSANG